MNKMTILIVAVLLVIGGALYYSGRHTIDLLNPEKESIALKPFTSYDELKTFLKESRAGDSYGYGGFETREMAVGEAAPMAAKSADVSSGVSATEYSTTNIQVEGVDEADIVKNDGKYIYTISGNKVIIVDAYPAENAKIVSELEFEQAPYQIFVNKDRLIVFGSQQEKIAEEEVEEPGAVQSSEGVAVKSSLLPYYYPRYTQKVFTNVYDISDRSDPKLVDTVTVRGYYFNSRMIGDYVYLIANEDVYYYEDRPIPLPALERNGIEKTVPATEILCPPYPDYSYRYTNILALNVQDKDKPVTHRVVLTGNTQTMYMSLNNLYLTSRKYQRWIDSRLKLLEKAITPLLPTSIVSEVENTKGSELDDSTKWNKIGQLLEEYTDSLTSEERLDFNKKMETKAQEVQMEIAKETEQTVIHRISVDKGVINYESEGEVPGTVLNQFSMDEYDSHFRIATTAGYASTRAGEPTSSNNIYVLNMDLDIVGEVEDLAPGERIYSARFMGKRCYLVTFRNIDPLFVIDLSEPTNPKVLGQLKIPGYSDYLHPYDEDHIIGLGKWTMDAKDQDFAWYQGLKISFFDVSDVTKPKEISKYELGDRGTDSYALHDHKAFLFDKKRNLLVIPVLLAEIDKEQYPAGIEDWQYGEYKFQGAYVFNVDLEKGIQLKGRVTHIEDQESFLKSGHYYYNDAYSVKRSLYIDDVLYTLSSNTIKMNRLDDLEELNKVKLPYEEEKPYVDYMMGGI